ncbi:interferon regulatory factor 9-like isoform X2 [Poecile atricapillus]|uniref:interferon regulatory factor 9-like isoform X2 n=1 Tax=Poecile atricapillus TaxID=48891 RepID=UPI002739A7EC|nr:interferon regulatory factor 9-like isoform X2 [Poecile atricapillus]
MAEGGPRRLRPWLLAQLRSGRFPGLQWDDAAQTALRIPWAHGGRSGAKDGPGAALCRAWAEYKGRVRPGDPPDPAGWKTRLRCALARSPEFRLLPGRGRPDGPSPYRVYRLLPAREPKPPKARQSQKEGGLSPPEPLPPTPPPETQEGAQDDEDPAEILPQEASPLRIEVESTEPLPPAHGDSALLLRLRHGPALAWQGALPPGEYLLSPPGRQGAPPPLPRLVLRAGAGLGRGLLLSSAPRGLFLRMRPGDGPAPGPVRGPHAPHGPLQQGALLQPFDARRFREELELHRAGLGPRPPHRVTLELGPPDGDPQGGGLLLELEQAFAQRLLDTLEIPPDPSGTPPEQ